MALSPKLLRPKANNFTPKSIAGLALWLDASSPETLYTTDAGAVTPVSWPTEIAGCALWLDASDSSTITHTGGAVSEWRDKTTNGRHYTASTTARPSTATRTQNGLNVIDFDGVNHQMSGNAASLSLFRNVSSGHVFVVAKMDTTAANPFIFSSSTASASHLNRAQVFVDGSGNLSIGGRRLDADGFQYITVPSVPTVPTILSAHFDWASSDLFFRREGAVVSSLTTFQTDGATSDTNSLASALGGAGAGFRMDGYIAEIIVFNTAITSAQRASVEAYLAAKWGISGVHAPATATNDPVGAWLDKSGNARHATQSTGANRPVIHSATQNGRRILSFDGSNDVLLGTGAQALKAGMTVIGAYFVGNVNYSSLFCVGDTVAGKRWLSGSSLSKVGIDYYTNALSVQADARNRTGITSFTFNPSANSLGIRMDGAQVISQASISPALAAYSSDTFAVAGVPLANEQWLAGRIFELAVYNRVLSAAECRRVEQALAAKWAITLAPQVSNADAQDWITRVYANGGTVSASTAAAVNTLCIDLENASLRDRFYRLNLFCGTGLNAALVPLYRGPSLGGTQYGNTTDTNVGPFVSGDYAETNGLDGDGVTKYLNTGLSPDGMGVPATVHLAAFKGAGTWTTSREFIGTRDADDLYQLQMRYPASLVPSLSVLVGGSSSIISEVAVSTAASFLIATRSSSSDLFLWQNGIKIATGTTHATTPGACANPYMVFTRNASGTAAASQWEHAMRAYSIGLGLNDSQAVAYNTAMQTFQTALGRNV